MRIGVADEKAQRGQDGSGPAPMDRAGDAARAQGVPSGEEDRAVQSPELSGLLAAAAAGDQGAWRSIVDLYARRVYALARSRLGSRGGVRGGGRGVRSGPWVVGDDDAEEVTQSVFCTIANKLSTGAYTEQGRFESWLFRVAMNRIRDEARRRRRQAAPSDPGELGERPASTDAAPAEAEPGDEVSRLRAAMEHLGDADREVVELRHHAGMSFRQIADMLDEPLGTLLARHHRALRKLKDLMTAPAVVNAAGDGKAGRIVENRR